MDIVASNFRLDEAFELLTRTPATLRALLAGLSEPWTTANEGGDTFSAFDVVGHMLEGEQADWVTRARIILDHGTSQPFKPFDRVGHRERNKGRTLESLLNEFERLRLANVAEVRSWALAPAALDKRGVHPAFGEVTLRQLLATWVAHDLGHLAQISRVMAKRYRDDVGPWIAYLPVLTDRPVPKT